MTDRPEEHGSVLTAEDAPKPLGRRLAVFGVKALISAGLLWLTFNIAGDSVDFSALRLEAPEWLALAFGLLAVIVLLLAIRWRLVAQALGGAPEGTGLGAYAALIWCGIAVSQVVPGGISGDAVRIWGLKIRGAPVWRAVETVALDRILGLVGLLALGSIGWLALEGWGGLAPLAGLGLAGIAGAWIGWKFVSSPARPEKPWAGLRDRIAAWSGFVASPHGGACLALAAAGHAVNVLVFVAVARAFGLDLPLAASFLAVPAGLFAAALPVSLGGWGVREIAVATGFAALGGDEATAIQASILFGAFHLCANAPALILLLGLRWGSRR